MADNGLLTGMLRLAPSPRPWHFPLLAGLGSGVPLLLGAALGQVEQGLLGALGGMVLLYMPLASMADRMVTLAVCAFGFALCFTLAALTGGHLWGSAAMLALITMLVNLICRYYAVLPPGRFFFVMIAAMASTVPFELSEIPAQTGLLMMGAMSACLLAFGYSLLVPVKHSELTRPAQPDRALSALWLESALIGAVVGGSLLLALALGLHNPYWVPISCAAIMQGNSVSVLLQRKLHRILGTAVGLMLAWLLFSLEPGPWWLALLVIVLTFIIETLVVRNYGLAVIFITPLTVLFASMMQGGALSPDELVLTRMLDIALGSLCGFVGGSLLQWLPSPRRA
ncbi:hypothetical protein GU3_12240 [Oceanimonas sp. GK1]|uniref:FUSC family protein n=1 Tax=Oceanimonas sp. (strain GK1 / IBRC-M 10197) TaxID=511062 RepID=UPI0002494FBE|nr:FUSC family protein [Oceanimonas sp. GK1]AEY02203.1 hypothetical protein GU3_12240 [Oceanimonas sp. GK1]